MHSLSVTVTGLSAIAYGLSVSLYCLSVTKIPDSRTPMLKVPNWPLKLTGPSGTFTDRLAKVTDCTVIFPAQSLCHHIQSESPYFGQAGNMIQTLLLTDRAGSVTDGPSS